MRLLILYEENLVFGSGTLTISGQKKTNIFCPNLKFLSLLLYVFIRRDLIQISRPLSPPFLCIILLILSHIQRPLHPSSRFSSMSQWRVNNSWSGCLLVEMKSCEKSRIHVLISERPFSPKTRRERGGGSRCAPPRRVAQAATTTPSWLHYITSAAFMTVTREPFEAQAWSHPQRPGRSLSRHFTVRGLNHE